MKFRKPRIVLFGIGLGLFVVSAVLFFLVPVICKDVLTYSAVDSFVRGLSGLVSFNFSNATYTALFILACIAIAGTITYCVTTVVKKHASHIVFGLVSLIVLIGTVSFLSSYFNSNATIGGITDKLVFTIFRATDSVLGKFLTAIVLVTGILSAIFIVSFMFIDSFSAVLTEQVNDLEKKIADANEAAAIAEKQYAEAIAPVPPFDPNDGIEDRKAKEMALFKSCVETGYFDEYEELEFDKPIEGLTEEPVCEGDEIEERSAFITSSSIHVDYARK